jgi:hypothetical protein
MENHSIPAGRNPDSRGQGLSRRQVSTTEMIAATRGPASLLPTPSLWRMPSKLPRNRLGPSRSRPIRKSKTTGPWALAYWQPSAPIESVFKARRKQGLSSEWLQSLKKAANPDGSTFAGLARNSSANHSTSLLANRFASAIGLQSIINNKGPAAKAITPRSELWLTNGSASSSVAGKPADPMTLSFTSLPCCSVARLMVLR